MNLDFARETFDLIFCAEVLEHIPPKQLKKVCSELAISITNLQNFFYYSHPNWVHMRFKRNV